MNMPFTSEPMENCGISDRDQHFGASLKRIQLLVGKRYLQILLSVTSQCSIANRIQIESTKIRPSFRKQSISKVEVIERCYQHKCSLNLTFLTEKNWNDYNLHLFLLKKIYFENKVLVIFYPTYSSSRRLD